MNVLEKIPELERVFDPESKTGYNIVINSLLKLIFLVATVLGFFVIAANIYSSFILDRFELILIDLIVYVIVVAAYLSKSNSIKIKSLIIINYLIGFSHFISSTPELGYFWMMLVPIVSIIFYTRKITYLFLSINFFFPAIALLLIDHNIIESRWLYSGYNLVFNIVTLCSVFMINLILVNVIYLILKHLKEKIKSEENYIEELKLINKDQGEEIEYKSDELKMVLDQLRNTNDYLEKMLEKEKEYSEMQENLVSTISHEYRTPLTVILNNVTILEKSFETQNEDLFKKSINRIYSSVEQKMQLIQRVLNFEKAISEVNAVEIIDLDLSDILNSILSELDKNDRNRIKIDLEYDKLKSNRLLLEQALENLILNALKYSTGEIEVVSFLYNGIKSIYIKDKGIGIPKEDIDKVFSPFFRASNTSKQFGSGVGLSIVKRNLERCNAQINVESELNKGSKFTIIFS